MGKIGGYYYGTYFEGDNFYLMDTSQFREDCEEVFHDEKELLTALQKINDEYYGEDYMDMDFMEIVDSISEEDGARLVEPWSPYKAENIHISTDNGFWDYLEELCEKYGEEYPTESDC